MVRFSDFLKTSWLLPYKPLVFLNTSTAAETTDDCRQRALPTFPEGVSECRCQLPVVFFFTPSLPHDSYNRGGFKEFRAFLSVSLSSWNTRVSYRQLFVQAVQGAAEQQHGSLGLQPAGGHRGPLRALCSGALETSWFRGQDQFDIEPSAYLIN